MGRKKKVEEPEKPKYPSLILGLDISTACIGISIVFDDGVSEPDIIKITHVSPKISPKIKGIEALILRRNIFEEEFLKKIYDDDEVRPYYEKGLPITECIIESPLQYSSGNSNAKTVSQLLQFNGLLSDSVYRVLGIVPNYVSAYDARMMSFPELLSIRKFNQKGEEYSNSHVMKNIRDNHLVLFGSYPFDCDKKLIMMNAVCEKFPDIKWVYNAKNEMIKEDYDACDSLVCVLAFINGKRYGKMEPKIETVNSEERGDNCEIVYVMDVWGKKYEKKILLHKD